MFLGGLNHRILHGNNRPWIVLDILNNTSYIHYMNTPPLPKNDSFDYDIGETTIIPFDARIDRVRAAISRGNPTRNELDALLRDWNVALRDADRRARFEGVGDRDPIIAIQGYVYAFFKREYDKLHVREPNVQMLTYGDDDGEHRYRGTMAA